MTTAVRDMLDLKKPPQARQKAHQASVWHQQEKGAKWMGPGAKEKGPIGKACCQRTS